MYTRPRSKLVTSIGLFHVLMRLRDNASHRPRPRGAEVPLSTLAKHIRVRTYCGNRASVVATLAYAADMGLADCNVGCLWFLTDDGRMLIDSATIGPKVVEVDCFGLLDLLDSATFPTELAGETSESEATMSSTGRPTFFRVGQNVVAHVTAQKLKVGQAYNVRRIYEHGNSIIGISVVYVLADSSGRLYPIVNGHLLLRADR